MKFVCGTILALGFVWIGDGDLDGRLGCSWTILFEPYTILELPLLPAYLDYATGTPNTLESGKITGSPIIYPAGFKIGTYSYPMG